MPNDDERPKRRYRRRRKPGPKPESTINGANQQTQEFSPFMKAIITMVEKRLFGGLKAA